MSIGEDRVRVEADGAVRILTLSRPDKLNAADLALQRRYLEALREIEADEAARAVVLTGAGRAFCAGGDLELAHAAAEGRLPHKEELTRIQIETNHLMLDLAIPIIAAVRGPAVGFGAGLVAMCDVVVMAEGAFLSDPHAVYGIPPCPPTQVIWPRLTSHAIAKELLMSGRRIYADEALAIGLARRVVPPGEEFAAAVEAARVYLELPKHGVALARRALNAPVIRDLDLIVL